MGIVVCKEVELEKPVLIASWPGIGNIGVIAVNALRQAVRAEEFAEIEPWEFFYPNRVVIREGELVDLGFPSSNFYYKKTDARDLMFFLGEEQPSEVGMPYAQGSKAYRMANLVLDVAIRFGCERVSTSGRAVAPIH